MIALQQASRAEAEQAAAEKASGAVIAPAATAPTAAVAAAVPAASATPKPPVCDRRVATFTVTGLGQPYLIAHSDLNAAVADVLGNPSSHGDHVTIARAAAAGSQPREYFEMTGGPEQTIRPGQSYLLAIAPGNNGKVQVGFGYCWK